MTFKLSGQLDDVGDPNLPFKLYESYIQHNKSRFPESVLKIIAHSDWSGGSQSKAPYYSQLASFSLTNVGTQAAELKLILTKEMYVEKPFNIEITYVGLFALDIPSQQGLSDSNLMWRYEQFLYFRAGKSSALRNKFFTHQIEWTDGTTWSVTAQEIQAHWNCA